MRSRLKYTTKNAKKISNYRKVYLVVQYCGYGVIEYPFAGRFVNSDQWYKEPLVWNYDDHDGCYDEFVLEKISKTTNGSSFTYTFNEQIAYEIADSLNKSHRFNLDVIDNR